MRPRTVSLPPDEMISLGEEMIKWVKKNDPLHLSQWYTIEKGYTYNEWKSMIVKDEFYPYYEKALKLVAIKYLDGESKKIKQGISERWQRVYFKDLREDEDETARYHSELRQKEAVQVSAEDVERAQRILEQVSRNQSASRNIEDTNVNATIKS